jgi:Na+-driven multidrug efflux pump
LVIQAMTALAHLFLAWFFIEYHHFDISGAIWAKNISDVINCLALYIYIVEWEPTKDTWIEWSIKAANGWV